MTGAGPMGGQGAQRPATIVYLDVDDEITSAAARLRTADELRVALVVPYGSRLATSRINFRLLAREAQSRGRILAIVAADNATRALAASAGLPAYATVGEYEGTLGERGADEPPGGQATTAAAAVVAAEATESERPSSPPAAAPPHPRADLEKTVVIARPDAPVTGQRPVERGASLPVVAGGRRWAVSRTPLLVGGGLLALLVLIGGVAAYVFLPSATIRVVPRVEPVSPVRFEVTADPAATTTDPASGVIPARRLTFAVDATDTFPATGKRVVETKATGSVTFENYDPTASNTIPQGSVVSTEGGIKFRTLERVVIPAGQFVLPSIVPGTVSVDVEAIAAGPSGNVAPNTIRAVPSGESATFTRVTNPQATTGGNRQEFTRIDQKDVDAAIAQLTQRLNDGFTERLADPASVPEGMTLFPETKALAEPTPSVDPASLVGQEVDSFEIGLAAEGTVTAVDQAPLRSLAEARIRSSVDAGHWLVEDSIEVATGDPRVAGETVVFPVVGRADQVQVLDGAELLAKVKGHPVAEARSILEPYGDVTISTWPSWVTSIPTIDARVSLEVGPAARASSSPGPSTSSSPSRSAPSSPTAEPSGSAAP